MEELTPFEIRIATLICEDNTTKEIAGKTGKSTRTIEHHRDELRRKLGVRTVAGLIKPLLKGRIVPLFPTSPIKF